MMSEQKKEWKVGDELAIHHGLRDGDYTIYEITKITKGGRITLGKGAYVLNPDLSIRGLGTWSRTHSTAYPVSADVLRELARFNKEGKVAGVFRNLHQSLLTDEELDRIIAINEAANQREAAKHAHRHQAD
jgi:hypothetical protein